MLIYNKVDGRVLAKVSGSQTLETYCPNMINKVSAIYVDLVPDDYKEYKIINEQLVYSSQ